MTFPSGASPPLFTLQSGGAGFELSQALGRDRILIAFSPSLGWLQQVARREGELADYQRQVLAVTCALLDLAPQSSAWLHIGAVEASEASVLEVYGVGEGEARAFLIGKDGGVKRVFAGRVVLSEVLALIDAMPMRRAQRQAQTRTRREQ